MGSNRAFHEAPLPLFTPAPDPAGDEALLSRAGLTAGAGRVPSYLADHRARLRERFMQGGAGAMPDYELLELVLFRAIPRQDVKPLARRLMDGFGDFNRVLSAPPARLEQVDGVGPAVVAELKIVEALKAGKIKKPLVSWVTGTCSKMFPAGVQFGEHATRSRAGAAGAAADVEYAEGTDQERIDLDQKVRRYADEHKVSYSAAYAAVTK